MKSWNLDIIFIPIAVACLAVAAQLIIKLPDNVSVAPITGQTLAVVMIAELMDWKKGSLVILLYLLLGGLGLPLFADFESGWEKLFGTSLGYFIGFFLAVLLCSFLADKGTKTIFPTAARVFIATLIILICGWIGLLRFLSPAEAFTKGVLPFLPGGLIKWFLAVVLVSLARRFTGLMGQIKEEEV